MTEILENATRSVQRIKHRGRKGVVHYRTDSPDFPTGLWGYEDWTVSYHGDGSRVLRARCELHDHDPLIRDVIQSCDAAFHPLDAYVRLTIDDRFHGNARYRFTDTTAEFEGFSAEHGPISGHRQITRDIRGFGAHPVQSDAWLTARYDLSKGPGIQTFHNNLMSSIDHRGATGPGFELTTSSSLQYFGVEQVTVPAGRYECHHFAFVGTSNNHPPYNLWTTADGDYVFVKGLVEGEISWMLDLVEETRF